MMIPKKDFDEKRYREAMQIYIRGLYGIKEEQELARPVSQTPAPPK
jgi:hypothetical protein